MFSTWWELSVRRLRKPHVIALRRSWGNVTLMAVLLIHWELRVPQGPRWLAQCPKVGPFPSLEFPRFLFPVPQSFPVPATHRFLLPWSCRPGGCHRHCSWLLCPSIPSNPPISRLWTNSAFPFLSWGSPATEKYWGKLQTYSFSFQPCPLGVPSASLKLPNLGE